MEVQKPRNKRGLALIILDDSLGNVCFLSYFPILSGGWKCGEQNEKQIFPWGDGAHKGSRELLTVIPKVNASSCHQKKKSFYW